MQVDEMPNYSIYLPDIEQAAVAISSGKFFPKNLDVVETPDLASLVPNLEGKALNQRISEILNYYSEAAALLPNNVSDDALVARSYIRELSRKISEWELSDKNNEESLKNLKNLADITRYNLNRLIETLTETDFELPNRREHLRNLEEMSQNLLSVSEMIDTAYKELQAKKDASTTEDTTTTEDDASRNVITGAEIPLPENISTKVFDTPEGSFTQVIGPNGKVLLSYLEENRYNWVRGKKAAKAAEDAEAPVYRLTVSGQFVDSNGIPLATGDRVLDSKGNVGYVLKRQDSVVLKDKNGVKRDRRDYVLIRIPGKKNPVLRSSRMLTLLDTDIDWRVLTDPKAKPGTPLDQIKFYPPGYKFEEKKTGKAGTKKTGPEGQLAAPQNNVDSIPADIGDEIGVFERQDYEARLKDAEGTTLYRFDRVSHIGKWNTGQYNDMEVVGKYLMIDSSGVNRGYYVRVRLANGAIKEFSSKMLRLDDPTLKEKRGDDDPSVDSAEFIPTVDKKGKVVSFEEDVAKAAQTQSSIKAKKAAKEFSGGSAPAMDIQNPKAGDSFWNGSDDFSSITVIDVAEPPDGKNYEESKVTFILRNEPTQKREVTLAEWKSDISKYYSDYIPYVESKPTDSTSTPDTPEADLYNPKVGDAFWRNNEDITLVRVLYVQEDSEDPVITIEYPYNLNENNYPSTQTLKLSEMRDQLDLLAANGSNPYKPYRTDKVQPEKLPWQPPLGHVGHASSNTSDTVEYTPDTIAYTPDVNNPTVGDKFNQESISNLLTITDIDDEGNIEFVAEGGYIGNWSPSDWEKYKGSLTPVTVEVENTAKAVKTKPAEVFYQPDVTSPQVGDYFDVRGNVDRGANPSSLTYAFGRQLVRIELDGEAPLYVFKYGNSKRDNDTYGATETFTKDGWDKYAKSRDFVGVPVGLSQEEFDLQQAAHERMQERINNLMETAASAKSVIAAQKAEAGSINSKGNVTIGETGGGAVPLSGTMSVESAAKRVHDLKSIGYTQSIVFDGESISGLQIDMTAVIHPEVGEDTTQLRFRLTPEFFAEFLGDLPDLGFTDEDSIRSPLRIKTLYGIKISNNELAFKHTGIGGHTYVKVLPDGTQIRVYESEPGYNDTFVHGGAVEVFSPGADFTEDRLRSVLQELRVPEISNNYATQQSLLDLAETRLLQYFRTSKYDVGTFDESTPAGKNNRVQALKEIETEWGVTPSTVLFESGPDGKLILALPDNVVDRLITETKTDQLVSSLSVGEGDDDIDDILMLILDSANPGMLSTVQRKIKGINGSKGMSEREDKSTGGADFVFIRPASSRSKGGTDLDAINFYSETKVVYDPRSVLRRLDIFAYSKDTYGAKNEGYSHYAMWIAKHKNKDTGVPEMLTESFGEATAEIMARHYIPSSSIIGVATPQSKIYKSIIERLKEAGIFEINGVPLDLFFTDASGGGMTGWYSKYLDELAQLGSATFKIPRNFTS